MKMLFTGLGRSILGETVPSVWVPGTQDLGHSFSQYGPPIRNFKVITPCRPSYIINYRAKNHVVMFCLGLQSIARSINTNASYFNTHRLESEGKFSWNFYISVGKKMKKLFSGIGRSILGETVPSVWVTGTQDLGHNFSQYGPPTRNFKVITPCRPSDIINGHLIFFLYPPRSHWRQPKRSHISIDRFCDVSLVRTDAGHR